jgi:hypothetical protein
LEVILISLHPCLLTRQRWHITDDLPVVLLQQLCSFDDASVIRVFSVLRWWRRGDPVKVLLQQLCRFYDSVRVLPLL